MLVTHATQTIKLTLQYEIQIGAKALSELKPISRGTWAVQTNAVSIPRVERLQLTAKPQLFLHITYGYTLCPSPGHEKEARTQQSATLKVCVSVCTAACRSFPLELKVCVSVCTAACRSFPLEHAYTHDVMHTRYESKEPALYVII